MAIVSGNQNSGDDVNFFPIIVEASADIKQNRRPSRMMQPPEKTTVSFRMLRGYSLVSTERRRRNTVLPFDVRVMVDASAITGTDLTVKTENGLSHFPTRDPYFE